jgi:hypothetical protein
LKGRVPGEYQNETPDIRILNDNYIKTLDDNGGVTPPLVDQKFLSKWKDQKAFVDRISTAILGFPPKNYVKFDSDMRIAAYILYKNCGKVLEKSSPLKSSGSSSDFARAYEKQSPKLRPDQDSEAIRQRWQPSGTPTG